jgi:hypothetical protein
MECHSILINKSNLTSVEEDIIRFLESYRTESVETQEAKNILSEYFDLNGWIQGFRYSSTLRNTITAVKGDIGLCAPFGNIARMFYDVLKLEYCYANKIIESGILVCPLTPSGNRAYLDRFSREIREYSKIIRTPICAIGVKIME